jgi:YbbR domain-containing protein
MNTLFSTEKLNILCKALTSVAFGAAILVAPAVSAQTITASGNTPMVTKSNDKFEAIIFPVENSAHMKINFVNPQEEKVVITIYNTSNTAVYQKVIGRDTAYRGKFDLSMLADGDYTVKVKSQKDSFTRKLSLKTQKERLALAI